MKGIEIREPGGPEVLQWTEVEVKEPGEGEVRIEVHAAGVNRPDVFQREGRYPAPPGASPLPGLEVAGVVEAVGRGVWELKPGDRICALVPGGGYAERCVAPAATCLPVPPSLALVDAAALPETVFTVWANLFDSYQVTDRDLILVHGGSSGIGTNAIQMIRAAGGQVFVTAGSAERARRCEVLGAQLGIDYRGQDFVERIREHTGSEHPLTAVLDMVGGDYVPRNLSLLAPGGRHVSIAFLRGTEATVSIADVMRRRLTLTGSTLRARPVMEKARLRDAVFDRVWPWLDQGKVRPVISHRLPMAEAAEAHRLMESSEHFGKLVLVTDLSGG